MKAKNPTGVYFIKGGEIVDGDKDSTVPISWSEDAKELIPDCEFHVIKNGGHESSDNFNLFLCRLSLNRQFNSEREKR